MSLDRCPTRSIRLTDRTSEDCIRDKRRSSHATNRRLKLEGALSCKKLSLVFVWKDCVFGLFVQRSESSKN